MPSQAGGEAVAPVAAQPVDRTVRLLRLAQSALALAGGGLVAISLFVSWWALTFSYPASGGTMSGTIHFFPGGSAQAVINGAWTSLPYASIETSVESLYGMVEVAAITIGVAAAVTAVFAALAATSVKNGSWTSLLAGGFNLAALIGALLLVGLFPIAAPQSLPNGPVIYGGCRPGNSPCTSFYGSFSANGTSQSWGPEAGWYLAIGALALLVIAVSVWFVSVRRTSGAETGDESR